MDEIWDSLTEEQKSAIIEIDKNRRPLTEQEKWNCTARWLNALYTAYFYGDSLLISEPCDGCQSYRICPSIAYTASSSLMVSTPTHFKVLEQFTGKGTIVGPVFPFRKSNVTNTVPSEHMDTLSTDISPCFLEKDCTFSRLPSDTGPHPSGS